MAGWLTQLGIGRREASKGLCLIYIAWSCHLRTVHMLSSTFKRSLTLPTRSLRTFHSTARIMGVDIQVSLMSRSTPPRRWPGCSLCRAWLHCCGPHASSPHLCCLLSVVLWRCLHLHTPSASPPVLPSPTLRNPLSLSPSPYPPCSHQRLGGGDGKTFPKAGDKVTIHCE